MINQMIVLLRNCCFVYLMFVVLVLLYCLV